MMKTTILILLIFGLCCGLQGQSIHASQSDKIFVTSGFTGWVSFPDSLGEFGSLVYSTNPYTGLFLSRMDTTGTFLWARNFETESYQGNTSICTDQADNVYLAGSFVRSIQFSDQVQLVDPDTLPWERAFVAKYDSSGNFVWGLGTKGANLSYAVDLAMDEEQNLYFLGKSEGKDFSLADSLSVADTTEKFNGFLAKLDAAGNPLWLRQFYVPGSTYFRDLQPRSVSVDTQGYVYVAGHYQRGPIFFDGLTQPYSGKREDVFVAKLDSMGNAIWLKRIYSKTGGVRVHDVEAVDSNAIYLSGSFLHRLYVGADSSSFADMSETDAYVIKLDAQGKEEWVVQGSPYDPADDLRNGVYNIAIGPNGNIFAEGSYEENLSFGYPTALQGFGHFLLKMAPDSTALCLDILTNRYSSGLGITVDSKGNVYSLIRQDFNTSWPFTIHQFGNDCNQGFVVEIDHYYDHYSRIDRSGIPGFEMKVFPNPTEDQTVLTFENAHHVDFQLKLFNVYGQLLEVYQPTRSARQITLNLASYANGIYFLKIESEAGSLHEKIWKR